MKRRTTRSLSGYLILVLSAVTLGGCPTTGAPQLSVTPSALNFGGTGSKESIAIFNAGGGTLEWSMSEDIDWLQPSSTEGTTTSETDRVTLTVDRSGMNPGTYSGTIAVTSNGGNKTIPVVMKVPGTPVLQVSPETLSLVGVQTETTLRLTNNGDDVLSWHLEIVDPDNPNGTIALPEYLTISPVVGSIPAGGQVELTITLDRTILGDGNGSQTFRIVTNAGTQLVPLNVTRESASELVVDPKVLEFGDRLTQLTFDVYNNGAVGSVLNFSVTTDRPDLIFFTPTSGTSTGTRDELVKDIVTVSVTLDRSALKGESDSGKIFVSVPGQATQEVLVTAEAAPLTFEGAINRSRPPFVMRFVFLLRDKLGQAIDTTDPAVLNELQSAFKIEEDKEPLDTDETNLFVTGPENLKYNVTLLLDYTGSMYNAAGGNGQAIQQMVASAREFIRDLPPTYRLSLMEYHERQQTQRLIHGFSTQRDALLEALDAFHVPPANHGASELFDALVDAIERMEKEDEGVLPFDDADVRALVFISDGRDTSSLNSLDETIQKAQDARVRLYPIGFGSSLRSDTLVQLAAETGGHYYPAPTVAELASLLEHETSTPEGTPGKIVTELSRQVVLTYLTLHQEGSHTYVIRGNWKGSQGFFEKDAVFFSGDVRAGQIALTTSGIESTNTAEVFVRAEYVPRNVSQLRFRFITDQPYTGELAPGGLLEDWVLVDEGGGVYTALTTEDRPLRYGSFGQLLKLTFRDLTVDGFDLGFRVDNRILVDPPFTRFFQYNTHIPVTRLFSATSTVVPLQLSDGFDPDAPGAFDADGDSVGDFDDLFPEDPNFSK